MNACLWNRIAKTFFVAAVIVFVIVVGTDLAKAGDYCLGDWDTTTQEYCDGLMTYARTIAVEHQVNRPMQEVMSEIPTARRTYLIPETLANNYIQFVYAQNPPLTPDTVANMLMGGCIDNAATLKELALKEIATE